MGALTRIWGFVRKEVLSVLRQPRLVATLILAPFLILVIFGLGYREVPPPFKTVLVLPGEQAQLAADTESLEAAFGSGIDLVSSTSDLEEARSRLDAGEVDLLIIAPDDAVETIRAGERAEFTIAHGEVDPVVRASISLLSRLSIDEINRRILAQVIDRAQEESAAIDEGIGNLRTLASELVSSLEAGDTQRAEELRGELDTGLQGAEDRAAADDLYATIAEALGTEDTGSVSTMQEEVAAADLDDPTTIEKMRQVESSLASFESQLQEARALEPDVLVSPFGAEVEEVALLPATPAVFYAPGALALLVQHLAVTFAALSLVRERQLGLVEVFRVSPLRVSEALIGKYVAFTLIGGSVAAVLTAAMFVFGSSPGDPATFAVTLLLMILASLGLGFLVSSVAQTDTQAVQYSMIILLVSIFFTGFVLSLDQLIVPVRVISFLLPATYGIIAMHDLMFRQAPVEPWILGGLGVYALVLGFVAWWAVRRDVARPD